MMYYHFRRYSFFLKLWFVLTRGTITILLKQTKINYVLEILRFFYDFQEKRFLNTIRMNEKQELVLTTSYFDIIM